MRCHALRFCVALLLANGVHAGQMTATPALAAGHEDPGAFACAAITGPGPSRSLRVGVFRRDDRDAGSTLNYEAFASRANRLPGVTLTPLSPRDYARADLSRFDVLVFPGGNSGAQGRSIGEKGRAAIRRYVDNGGGYLGICAGAYLATTGYPWSLGILNARTVSPHNWARGEGRVDVQLSESGRSLLGDYPQAISITYANGPILEPLNRADLPGYTVDAWYRSEIAENGTPHNVMINSPAFVRATYGRGRIVAISPHPELTPGLENVVPRVLLWLATGDQPVTPPSASLAMTDTPARR
ncbi:Biotin-protein ligase [Opitutaceae bacterium TAV5]|nr:Biotin-protein ligase [Opitutaceae bacterium TAV5]